MPETAARRGIAEECCATVMLKREPSRVTTAEEQTHYTFLADISTQQSKPGGKNADEHRAMKAILNADNFDNGRTAKQHRTSSPIANRSWFQTTRRRSRQSDRRMAKIPVTKRAI
ncbi:MAG TPA: hypothetical protein EYG11_25395 [Candidatus Latescibacteria bacterium]|nr:hypothetical protein [Candidatus Handelsmanbacteria bacterium]HIL12033.1 hypothetical protein [Candidatus Latescibacterota bacterium]